MEKERKQEGEMDMQAMMEVYKKLATPGIQHKLLEKLAGNWTTRTISWMEKGKPPTESSGTCTQRMILDGHYLQQEYASDMMGTPFTGINLIGYDNHTRKYVSIWIDSMSTGIYHFVGTDSEDGNVVTQECSYDDPVTGPTLWRSVTRFVDDNTLKYEMYMILKGGKEEKMSEMTVSRNR